MKPMLRRRLPVIRSMRFLRYDVSKDVEPEYGLHLNRCAHGKHVGVYARRGMRCYSWIWKLCK